MRRKSHATMTPNTETKSADSTDHRHDGAEKNAIRNDDAVRSLAGLFASVFTGSSTTSYSLFSGTPLKVFLNLPGLVGGQIRSHSHMSYDGAPLGRRELSRIARHMAAIAIHRP